MMNNIYTKANKEKVIFLITLFLIFSGISRAENIEIQKSPQELINKSSAHEKISPNLLFNAAQKDENDSCASIINVSPEVFTQLTGEQSTTPEENPLERFISWLKNGYNSIKELIYEKEEQEEEQKEEIPEEISMEYETAPKNITIAIIDSGGINVNGSYMDIQRLWKNPAEIPNDGLDNDGNGYIDDIYGVRFTENTGEIFDNSSFDHPTVCANISYTTAPESKIMYLELEPSLSWIVDNLSDQDLSNKTREEAGEMIYEKTLSEIMNNTPKAIRYAADNDADIISISRAWKEDDPKIEQAIDYAHSKGTLIVAPAGNNDLSLNIIPRYPIGYDNVVGVAGAAGDKRAFFSNYGDDVDISARALFFFGDEAEVGTSFAVPEVAGVSASVWAENTTLTATQIANILYNTADDIETPGWDIYSGYGMVNQTAALETVLSLPKFNSSAVNALINQPAVEE